MHDMEGLICTNILGYRPDFPPGVVLFIASVLFVEVSLYCIRSFHETLPERKPGHTRINDFFDLEGFPASQRYEKTVEFLMKSRWLYVRVGAIVAAIVLLWSVGVGPSRVMLYWHDFMFGSLADVWFWGDRFQFGFGLLSGLFRILSVLILVFSLFVLVLLGLLSYLALSLVRLPAIPARLRIRYCRYVVFPAGLLMLGALVIDYGIRPIVFWAWGGGR